MFATLAERRGDLAFAVNVRDTAGALMLALKDQWKGAFFNRAYVYDKAGQVVELGTENLWLAPNAFALLADQALSPEQTAKLVARMRSDLLDPLPPLGPSPLGLASQGAKITLKTGSAGFWYSLAGPALEGLAKRSDVPGARELAWDAFQRQTLAAHAEAYPTIWYGVWSGPDMYVTPLEHGPADMPTHLDKPAHEDKPGETWCHNLDLLPGIHNPVLCMRDFPVTNMFSHSEPVLGSVRMAGLSANDRGFTIDPVFPFESFKWQSRVMSITRSETETQGSFTAEGNDVIVMRVRVASAKAYTVSVNGKPVAFTRDNGFVRFELPVVRGTAALWSVRRRE